MTKEEMAIKLNNREYTEEITREEAKEAEVNGLVVAFGASDDLLEFRGAIYDEVGAYDRTMAFITPSGLLKNDCDNDCCPYFAKIKKETKHSVTAVWEKDGYSWVIDSTLPFVPFDILENGEKYCRGIVFELPKE